MCCISQGRLTNVNVDGDEQVRNEANARDIELDGGVQQAERKVQEDLRY